jgi:hypothetical protein
MLGISKNDKVPAKKIEVESIDNRYNSSAKTE